MLDRILAQMNATLQPDDEPYTIDDAQQHVTDYSAWSDGKLHQCNCEAIAPPGYETYEELSQRLNAMYGKGAWRLAGRYLETYTEKYGWSAYYRVTRYETGRYFLYDPHED